MSGFDDFSKQRIDYRDNADGSVTAILSVSLPGGRVERYEARVQNHEVAAASGALAPEIGALSRVKSKEELKKLYPKAKWDWDADRCVDTSNPKYLAQIKSSNKRYRATRGTPDDYHPVEVATIEKRAGKKAAADYLAVIEAMHSCPLSHAQMLALDEAWKKLRAPHEDELTRAFNDFIDKRAAATFGRNLITMADVARVAKTIASSKVFKLAAKGLAIVGAVAPPPIGTAALAAGGAMSAASKLASGKVAETLGAPKTAAKLVNAAKKDAAKTIEHLTKKKAVTPEKKAAMAKSLVSIANRKRKGAERLIAPSTVSVVLAARAGRLKSNRPGAVTPNQLKEAHAKGRVFWLTS